MFRTLFVLLFSLSSFPLFSAPYNVNLSPLQAEQLGLLIWKNEGKQKIQHLTTWNRGEDFPSLGLGHFIWYPTTKKGPFKEQFPQLIQFMSKQGVELPQWLIDAEVAPWKSREQFYAQFDKPPLTQLRRLLSEQLALQVRFIILRLENAIPHIIESSRLAEQKIITRNLQQLATPEGIFTLLDYVNFKGEGINEKERYQGEGWGLKQVLLAMPAHYENPLRSFGLAADEMLTRRVKNAPRDEFRWLKGWRARVHSYQNLNLK
ncbi:hypothetical protein [Psychromonas hadalis]|uniref:hypothetical protein n=1 Tax=Psychromonas hadalis TaxID=211669 RepID=UPI0003B47C22|nr:hypothetical protein [Psychromonas hadalis]